MTAQIERCRSCKAHIYYLKHERTQTDAPIEAQSSIVGSIAVDLEAGTYRIVPKAERAPGLHLIHFATCPDAASWRGKR